MYSYVHINASFVQKNYVNSFAKMGFQHWLLSLSPNNWLYADIFEVERANRSSDISDRLCRKVMRIA